MKPLKILSILFAVLGVFFISTDPAIAKCYIFCNDAGEREKLTLEEALKFGPTVLQMAQERDLKPIEGQEFVIEKLFFGDAEDAEGNPVHVLVGTIPLKTDGTTNDGVLGLFGIVVKYILDEPLVDDVFSPYILFIEKGETQDSVRDYLEEEKKVILKHLLNGKKLTFKENVED